MAGSFPTFEGPCGQDNRNCSSLAILPSIKIEQNSSSPDISLTGLGEPCLSCIGAWLSGAEDSMDPKEGEAFRLLQKMLCKHGRTPRGSHLSGSRHGLQSTLDIDDLEGDFGYDPRANFVPNKSHLYVYKPR